jgi:hypothetical protein
LINLHNVSWKFLTYYLLPPKIKVAGAGPTRRFEREISSAMNLVSPKKVVHPQGPLIHSVLNLI